MKETFNNSQCGNHNEYDEGIHIYGSKLKLMEQLKTKES